MNFRPAKCPNCGGALQLPDDRDTVNCMYCGGTIVVREAIQAAAAATVPNLLKLARSAAQSHNHQEAYDYYTRVLEVDGDNAEAWRGKAEACGCLSGPNSFRLPEMVEYYRNAIEATEGKKKEAARDEAANSISRVSLQYYRNARNGLSPAFAENASWELYLQTLGDVLKVLDQTLKVMPDNVMLLRTTMKICKDNPSKLSHINRRTGTRNWRYLSPEWQRAIESKLGYCSGELQRLDPTLASPEAEPSKSLLDSIMASPRLVPTIAFGLLLFVLVGLLLSAAQSGGSIAERDRDCFVTDPRVELRSV